MAWQPRPPRCCWRRRLLRSTPGHRKRNTSPACSIAPAPSRLAAFPLQMVFATTSRCRSEEHTSELQSLMRISYAVFCLKKKKNQNNNKKTKRSKIQRISKSNKQNNYITSLSPNEHIDPHYY